MLHSKGKCSHFGQTCWLNFHDVCADTSSNFIPDGWDAGLMKVFFSSIFFSCGVICNSLSTHSTTPPGKRSPSAGTAARLMLGSFWHVSKTAVIACHWDSFCIFHLQQLKSGQRDFYFFFPGSLSASNDFERHLCLAKVQTSSVSRSWSSCCVTRCRQFLEYNMLLSALTEMRLPIQPVRHR